jgi:hypothetical protein
MSAKLQFALRHLESAQWQLFERLASAFLADEFGTLRTLASPSGDGGRDAMLFQPDGEEEVGLQYSVSADWTAKIRSTARRLANAHPQVHTLVYATPLEIGAQADDLRTELRRNLRLFVDIRDQNWFVERERRSPATQEAAERFSTQVVNPVLQRADLLHPGTVEMNDDETRAALLYLVLEREDDQMDRQLTKLCFDALVRAVLRGTDNENRLPRSEIQAAVLSLLPSHDTSEVNGYTDRALTRLAKRSIRHWSTDDTYCLTYDERSRLAEGLAALELLNESFDLAIDETMQFVADGMEVDLSVVDTASIRQRIRRVMERFLFERGEAFVEALRSGQGMLFVNQEILEVAQRDLGKHADTSSVRHNILTLVSETIERVLLAPTDDVQHFLRAIADAYTLFAFLRETPNVQSAVTKLFSHGEIWLDTTAVLPLLAESLLEPPERGYSRLLRAAREAGVRFYVTNGVLDEIASHIDLSVRAWKSPNTWNSRTPFLLSAFIWSGRPAKDFVKWTEEFRGRQRPIDDLAIYLKEDEHIHVFDLKAKADEAEDAVRWQAEQYWYEKHEERRRSKPLSEERLRLLVQHDVECFLGVIQRRGGEQVGNPFGYSNWWLSLDRYAAAAAAEISNRAGVDNIDSPVLSFDFLSYYLAVGPARRQLDRGLERQLPLAVDTSLLDALPRDLLAAAEEARQGVRGQSERVVRRKIRDHLDKAKLRAGRVGKAGIEAIEADIRMALLDR